MVNQHEIDPYKRIEQLESDLEEALGEIAHLGQDHVSGLLTRTVFEQQLVGVFGRNRHDDQTSGIVLCDLDHLKGINDKHGHQMGDLAIGLTSKAIQSCVRSTDLVARYGGDEFIVALAKTDIVRLSILSERIRRAVEVLKLDGGPPLTFSIGFALQNPGDPDALEVIRRADESLYEAKRLGRNRVENDLFGHEEVQIIEEVDRRTSDQVHAKEPNP